jgi:hypothetical protein
MTHSHSEDIHIGPDGTRTLKAPKIVEVDSTTHGAHSGSTCVHAGTYTIAHGATNNGSVTVQPRAALVVLGTQNGSLHVHADASVEIRGAHNGSVHVDPGGVVRVAPGGKLAGSLDVGGRIENAGIRGGTVRTYADGEIVDVPGGTVKQPQIGPHGEHIYHW